MCAMEMVAWLAGEAHSDEPDCTCPVLAALTRATNDALGDPQRDRYLRPLVPQLVNTRADGGVEQARGMLALDCLVRSLLPIWLARHRRHDEAALLRALPEISTRAHVAAARRVIDTSAHGQRAANWVLDRALDGLPPARYVAGVVQVARALDRSAGWSALVDLLQRMARLSAAPVATSAVP